MQGDPVGEDQEKKKPAVVKLDSAGILQHLQDSQDPEAIQCRVSLQEKEIIKLDGAASQIGWIADYQNTATESDH